MSGLVKRFGEHSRPQRRRHLLTRLYQIRATQEGRMPFDHGKHDRAMIRTRVSGMAYVVMVGTDDLASSVLSSGTGMVNHDVATDQSRS